MERDDENAKDFRDNILISYSADIEEHPDWFIYEYESSRKVLVRIDAENGHVEFLKNL